MTDGLKSIDGLVKICSGIATGNRYFVSQFKMLCNTTLYHSTPPVDSFMSTSIRISRCSPLRTFRGTARSGVQIGGPKCHS